LSTRMGYPKNTTAVRRSALAPVRAGLLALALLVPAGASAADPPGTASSKAAKEHFESAQSLFDQKKYDAAMVLFRQAYEESKSPNARLMIGRCLLALGRLPEAHDELTVTVAEAAGRAESEPKYAKARDAAAAELAPLEAKVGKLVLTFASPRPGARVTVNGAAVPAARLGVPMAVLPGAVEIVVDGIGPQPVKQSETISAGQTRTVVLGGQPAATPGGTASTPPSGTGSAAPTATATSTPETPSPTTGGGVRIAGFVVAGIGAAGMVLFGVAGSTADSKLAQLQQECGGARCTDPKYGEIVDSGRMFDLLANIGLGAGIAGLVGGTAMIVFGGPKKAATTGSAAVDITPTGAVIRYKTSF
jgi:hypothetical protein